MSDRDTLSDVISRAYRRALAQVPIANPDEAIADELLESGWRPPPRVIKTDAELDDLPINTVILSGGQAWQSFPLLDGMGWQLAGSVNGRTSKYVLRVFGHATVLHIPQPEVGSTQ